MTPILAPAPCRRERRIGAALFSEKNIEDVAIRDYVWSRDDDNLKAEMELRQVTQVFRHQAFDLQQVAVRSAGGSVDTFNVTDEHPFYVEGQGWTDAVALRPGHRLVAPDGSVQTVAFNTDDYRPEGVTIYSFEVDGNHTDFVGDGVGEVDVYVWVHNACSNSYQLGTNLGDATVKRRAGYAAHHIVAATSGQASKARAVLKKYKIDINDAANGV